MYFTHLLRLKFTWSLVRDQYFVFAELIASDNRSPNLPVGWNCLNKQEKGRSRGSDAFKPVLGVDGAHKPRKAVHLGEGKL